jgi:SAM-dependent methyltransferase
LSKLAEQNYLSLTGEAGRTHSLSKPFSDAFCGVNLASIGTIMMLLPEPPARILDMGCGGGWTSIFYARRGYEVVGQDIAQDMVDLANENMAAQEIGKNLSFVCNDYEGTNFADEFDAVIFFDCLHHAEDERAALASAYRALKPGGMLITHEPGEGHSTAPGSIEAMELYGVKERDMPPHLILGHARELGFSSSRVFPMQHELIELFYREPIPPRYSKKGRERAKRALNAAFRQAQRASSLIVMIK